MLLKKLLEEAQELQNSPCVEEVADVLEVIDAVVKLCGFDCDEINRIKESKRDKRGGFDERVMLEYIIEKESIGGANVF